jgi:hypothetical protein
MDELVADNQPLAELVFVFADASVGPLVEEPESLAVFRKRRQQRERLIVRVAPVEMEVRLRASGAHDEEAAVKPDRPVEIEIGLDVAGDV